MMDSFKIFVLDDGSAQGTNVSAILHRAGYDVRTAANARSSVKQLAKFPADLVVMNAPVSHDEAVQLSEHIESLPSLQETPVVVICHALSEHARHPLRSKHSVVFLAPPIDARALTLLVATYLEEPHRW
jgi:DNA-binding NtrC family response regulator